MLGYCVCFIEKLFNCLLSIGYQGLVDLLIYRVVVAFISIDIFCI